MKVKSNHRDKLFILIGLIIVAGFYFLFYRKSQEITVTVKVTDQDVLYAGTNPKVWYSKEFEVGDYELDSLGRKITKVTRISKYYLDPERQVVLLDIRIKAIYDALTKRYYYKGKPVIFGTSLRFDLSKVTFDALVVNPNSDQTPAYRYVDVKTVTKGIPRFMADQLKKGDRVIDTNGDTLVELKDFTVKPAEEVTTDSLGNYHVRGNPVYIDLFMDLKVRCQPYGDNCIDLADRQLIIGDEIPVVFNQVGIAAMIISLGQQY